MKRQITKKHHMKKILLTITVLAGTFIMQAQTTVNSDINKLAKQYAKNDNNAVLEIPAPGHILIKEDIGGYSIEIEGIQNGHEYKIKVAHNRMGPAEECTINTAGKECDLEKGVIFDDAERITMTKEANKQTITIVKEGEGGYRFCMKQKGIASETRTVYSETNNTWDFNIPIIKQKKRTDNGYRPYSHFEFNILCDLEFGMGLVSAHSQAPGMDVGFDNAGWEFILNNLFNWEYNPFRKTHLSLGFGVDWRNYRMKGKNRFLKEDNKLIVAPYPDDADIDFSRVKVFSLTLELMLRQDINKKISIAAGPIVNFNTHASIKTRYAIGSGKERERFKETSSNIHQKPVTVDFKAQLNISPLAFYFKYSPTNTLDTDYGPEFKSMSTGICITF